MGWRTPTAQACATMLLLLRLLLQLLVAAAAAAASRPNATDGQLSQTGLSQNGYGPVTNLAKCLRSNAGSRSNFPLDDCETHTNAKLNHCETHTNAKLDNIVKEAARAREATFQQ